MKPYVVLGALTVALGLSACGDREEEVSPKILEARRAAAQGACISEMLARKAESDLAALDTAVAIHGADPSPSAQVQLRVAAAAERFARAYLEHAKLRNTVFAYADSAYNRARSSADSARFLAAGEAITIRMPEAETVEANAIRSYQQDFQSLRVDPDFRCSWDLRVRGEAE